jgi:trehalose 6-phosphate synthase
MRAIPDHMGRQILEGLLSSDLLGFQTPRWSRNFLRCCQDLLDAEVDFERGRVRYGDRETVVRHYPISIDVEAVRSIAMGEEAQAHVSRLENLIEGRKVILRVDRLELTKNIVRGLRAFEYLLRSQPEWRGKVVQVAMVYPSRRALHEYRAYEAEVLDTCDQINADLGTDDWQPILMFEDENYTRAIAALTLYDVLMVNPLADGMNLVSKEGPAVNQRDGVLVLSRNAGSWDELGAPSLGVNPFDIAEMAEALERALNMEQDERKTRAGLLREIVERNSPAKWVAHQLADISRLHES